MLLLVATDQKQSDVSLDNVASNFEASPVLAQLIENRTARELRLTNGCAARPTSVSSLTRLHFCSAIILPILMRKS